MIVIKYLDYLSPRITFYHKGFLSHASIMSGILSIFSIFIIITIAVYFSLDLIKRQNPTSFSFNRYIEDSGIFYFNASDAFHFLSLGLARDHHIDNGVDFTIFRVIGIDFYLGSYDVDFSKYNHWLYGLCNNESDTKGISHLIDHTYFLNSACIRKYYNATEDKYYDTSDKDFKWPEMSHGTYHPNKSFYGIFLETCHNETVDLVLGKGSHCKTPQEIKEVVISPSNVHLFYIDNYVDSLNYLNPNTKFFNRVENSFSSQSMLTNNLNIDPILVKTHNGLVLDNVEEDVSYTYERNDVLTKNEEDTGFYTGYYFWLSNRQNYYERKYKRIQDIFSEIGGLNQFVTIIATCINYLFYGYIVLSDTQDLLFSSMNTVKNGERKFKKEIVKPNKLENINKLGNIKKLDNLRNKKIIYKKNIDNLNTEKTNNKNDKNDKNIISHRNISTTENEHNTESIMNIVGEKSNKIEKKKTIIENKKIDNFLSYLVFKLSFEKKNTHHKIFKDFRMKMISEEHLVKNHLNIYNLLKAHARKKSFKRNSYHLRDLINLV